MKIRLDYRPVFTRVVASFIIVAFSCLSVVTAAPVFDTGDLVRTGSALAPEARFCPVSAPAVGDEYILKSLMLYRALKDPGIFTRKKDLFSGLNDKRVVISFSESRRSELKEDISGGTGKGEILIVPSAVDGAAYYTVLARYANGVIESAALTEDEGLSFLARLADRQAGLSRSGILPFYGKEIPAADITDTAVSLAVSFLGAAGCERMKERLIHLVDSGRVLAADKPVLVSGGIAMDTTLPDKYRALALLRQLFFGVNFSIDAADMDDMESAFTGFMNGRPVREMISPALRLTLIALERELSIVSNESGLEFDPEAYRTMWDLSDVDPDGDYYKTVISNIKRIILELNTHYKAKYEKYNKIFIDKDKWKPREEIIVKRISNGILPTVEEKENGVIIVNENFVKVMALIYEELISKYAGAGRYVYGLPDKTGVNSALRHSLIFNMPTHKFDLKGRPPILDFYETILHGTLIHSITGHFRVKNGVSVFEPDENIAQGERGRSFLLPNLACMLFFWMSVIEGRRDFTFDDAVDFLVRNEQLYRKENLVIAKNVAKLAERLPEDFPYNKVYLFRDHPRVPIPVGPEPTPGGVFISLSALRAPSDIYDLAAGMSDPSPAPREVERIADLLAEMGAVRKITERGGEPLDLTEYEAPFIADEAKRQEISELLMSMDGAMPLDRVIELKLKLAPFPFPDAPRGPESELVKDPVEMEYEDTLKVDLPLEPGRKKEEGSAPHIGWRNISSVYKYIRSRKAPVSASDIVDAARYKRTDVMDFYLKTLIDIGLVERTSEQEGVTFLKTMYAAVELPGRPYEHIAAMLGDIKTAPEETDMFEVKCGVADIVAGGVKRMPAGNKNNVPFTEKDIFSEGFGAEPDPGWLKIAELYRFLSGKKDAVTEEETASGAGFEDPAAAERFLSVLFGIGLVKRYAGEENVYMYTAVPLKARERVKLISLLESVESPPEDTDITAVKQKIDDIIVNPSEDIKKAVDSVSAPDRKKKTQLRAVEREEKTPGKAHRSWHNISLLYRYLSEDGLPVDTDRVAAHFKIDDVAAIGRLLAVLLKVGLVERYTRNKEGFLMVPLYRSVKYPAPRVNKIADMLGAIQTAPADTDLELVKKKIGDIITGWDTVPENSPADKNVSREKRKGTHFLWKNISVLYSYLFKKGTAQSTDDIARVFNITEIPAIGRLLSILFRLGLVDMQTKENEEYLPAPLYSAVKVPGILSGQIQGILRDITTAPVDTDIASVKGRILNVTDRIWSDALIETAVRNAASNAAEKSGGKIILALDTSWVPDVQEGFIASLVQAIENLESKAPVIVLRGKGAGLAGDIMAVTEKEGVPMANVVLLAPKNVLGKKEFDLIRAKNDNDTDKAFVVGVDPSELTDTSYIRLIEMLTFALRLSFGLEPFSKHTEIKVWKVNSRLYVFIPRASEVDFESVKTLYKAQKKTLTAA